MENKPTAPDKQNEKRPSPTALTAALLGLAALIFTVISLWKSASPLLGDARIGQAILALEAGVLPTEVPHGTAAVTKAPQSSSPVTSAEPPTAQTSSAAPQTETLLFPPAAANSPSDGRPIPPTAPNSAEKVITTQITASPGQGYLEHGDVYIKNNTRYSPDLAGLSELSLEYGEAPTVLIVHTHATECYTPTELDSYAVSQGDRSSDTAYNMVRVGEELASGLRELGIRVIHDRTLFDESSYSGAYARSNAAVKKWLKKDPSIAVVLDLHRDALNAEGETRYRLAVGTSEGDAAQMLILVGTDASGADHPDWEKNLGLGLRLQQELCGLAPGIMRPMLLTNSSYDQEVSPGALLIEVGANGNSLSDALVSARLLGKALGDILR